MTDNEGARPKIWSEINDIICVDFCFWICGTISNVFLFDLCLFFFVRKCSVFLKRNWIGPRIVFKYAALVLQRTWTWKLLGTCGSKVHVARPAYTGKFGLEAVFGALNGKGGSASGDWHSTNTLIAVIPPYEEVPFLYEYQFSSFTWSGSAENLHSLLFRL